MDRAKAAAGKIKDKINTNLENVAHRDREFLGAVCAELGIAASPVNMVHVMTLLHGEGLVTHEEFPKMVYPQGIDQPGVIVNTAAEERALRAPVKAK